MGVFGFYVTVETRHTVEVNDYAEVAEMLSHALFKVLGDPVKFRQLAHATTLSDARVELEISQVQQAPSSPVIARAVVQAESAESMRFDKTLFTAMLRTELPWAVTITKRAVPKDEHMRVLSQEFTVCCEPPDQNMSVI